jgi:uncharacterized coiled-coil DUF342 family protein
MTTAVWVAQDTGRDMSYHRKRAKKRRPVSADQLRAELTRIQDKMAEEARNRSAWKVECERISEEYEQFRKQWEELLEEWRNVVAELKGRVRQFVMSSVGWFNRLRSVDR